MLSWDWRWNSKIEENGVCDALARAVTQLWRRGGRALGTIRAHRTNRVLKLIENDSWTRRSMKSRWKLSSMAVSYSVIEKPSAFVVGTARVTLFIFEISGHWLKANNHRGTKFTKTTEWEEKKKKKSFGSCLLWPGLSNRLKMTWRNEMLCDGCRTELYKCFRDSDKTRRD